MECLLNLQHLGKKPATKVERNLKLIRTINFIVPKDYILIDILDSRFIMASFTHKKFITCFEFRREVSTPAAFSY